MRIYGVIGAGGFGREVMPMLKRQLEAEGQSDYDVIFVDESPDIPPIVNGYKTVSLDAFIEMDSAEKFFTIAIARFTNRKRLAEILENKGIKPVTVIGENHTSLDCNEIGEGAIFCPHTAVTSNVKIGRHFHCNIFSYVAHDCIIGDYVTLAPNAHCNGTITIEDYVYIGSGAVIRNSDHSRKITIGEGAVIGMGAVVMRSVPPHTTVIGNPARMLRRD